MNKAFENTKHNGIALTFPNGNWISTIWSVGSYSDNWGAVKLLGDSFLDSYNSFMDSDTVEVMFTCGQRLHTRLHNKFDGDGSIIGRLTIDQWLYIINALAKEVAPSKKGSDE